MASGSGKYSSYNKAVKKGIVASGGSKQFRGKKTKNKSRKAAIKANQQSGTPF
jgi:hypothetical protein